MILPIYAYGQPVLKKRAKEIDADFENLPELISNMWETMYNAKGIGLAAPQIGKSIRLFVIDTLQLEQDEEGLEGMKIVLINPEIVDEKGEEKAYEEGCLSIPDIRGDVTRKEEITIRYFDENFEEQTKSCSGINARVIQHEYDHIEGKLFTEQLQPLRRRLVKRKLAAIKSGKISTDYRMRFYVK